MKKTASPSLFPAIAIIIALLTIGGIFFLSRDVMPSQQQVEKNVEIGKK